MRERGREREIRKFRKVFQVWFEISLKLCVAKLINILQLIVPN
jgi:hypothetical protein